MNLKGFYFDWWTAWGMLAQVVFFGSFVVQWWKSEKARKSVLPAEFWVIRIIGTLMLIVYVFVRKDIVFLVSLFLQLFIYFRNIVLIKNEKDK